MKKSRLLGAVCACMFLLFTTVTYAAIVEFQFTGTVDGLDSGLTSEFVLGESVIGSYKVDDVTFAATDLMVTIGGDYVLTATTGSVSIWSGTWFAVAFNSGFTGNPIGGQIPQYFDIQLDDPNTVLQSGVLPLSYDISSFGNDRSNINFPDDLNRLDFTVLSITAVPIPAAVWLFGSGLLGLVGLARRKAA